MQHNWTGHGGANRDDRLSGTRGPRYSYQQFQGGKGTDDLPSGQFEAWSPLLTASEVISKRWKTVIVWLLGGRSRRFNELQSHMPGVTPKVLTEQLRELERDGIVARSVIPGGAKHVEYALTATGERLQPIVEQLQEWGRSYVASRNVGAGVESDRAEQGRALPDAYSIRFVDREQSRGIAHRADSHLGPHGDRPGSPGSQAFQGREERRLG